MATQRSKKSKERADAMKEFVMLAQEYDDSKHDPTGWWRSIKLDGLRARWHDGKLVSRSMKEFPTPPEILKIVKKLIGNLPVDGELYGGVGTLQKTSSVVRSTHSEYMNWLGHVKYHIFDVVNTDLNYADRMTKYLGDYDMQDEDSFIQIVPCFKIKSKEDVVKQADKVFKLGEEGIMLRDPDSPYVFGRTNKLLKVKEMTDLEAEVIEHIEGEGRNEKRLGALRCKMPSGRTFKVGSGFTDEQREKPPPIGSMVTVKFTRYTDDQLPFQPIFMHVREPE